MFTAMGDMANLKIVRKLQLNAQININVLVGLVWLLELYFLSTTSKQDGHLHMTRHPHDDHPNSLYLPFVMGCR